MVVKWLSLFGNLVPQLEARARSTSLAVDTQRRITGIGSQKTHSLVEQIALRPNARSVHHDLARATVSMSSRDWFEMVRQ